MCFMPFCILAVKTSKQKFYFINNAINMLTFGLDHTHIRPLTSF